MTDAELDELQKLCDELREQYGWESQDAWEAANSAGEAMTKLIAEVRRLREDNRSLHGRLLELLYGK